MFIRSQSSLLAHAYTHAHTLTHLQTMLDEARPKLILRQVHHRASNVTQLQCHGRQVAASIGCSAATPAAAAAAATTM